MCQDDSPDLSRSTQQRQKDAADHFSRGVKMKFYSGSAAENPTATLPPSSKSRRRRLANISSTFTRSLGLRTGRLRQVSRRSQTIAIDANITVSPPKFESQARGGSYDLDRAFRQRLHEGAAVGFSHDAIVENYYDAAIGLGADQTADALAKFQDRFRQ